MVGSRLAAHAAALARESLRLKRLGDRGTNGWSHALRQQALAKFAQYKELSAKEAKRGSAIVVRSSR